MSNYEKDYQLFGLPVTTPVKQIDPNKYAEQFKRCTVLRDDQVTYSNGTERTQQNHAYHNRQESQSR